MYKRVREAYCFYFQGAMYTVRWVTNGKARLKLNWKAVIDKGVFC
jgi:hypothetical protein